jgi:hypothetical protein
MRWSAAGKPHLQESWARLPDRAPSFICLKVSLPSVGIRGLGARRVAS